MADNLEKTIEDLGAWVEERDAMPAKPATKFLYRPKDFTEEEAREVVRLLKEKFQPKTDA